jgi:sulfite reductase beta subunit-like hemoprotein
MVVAPGLVGVKRKIERERVKDGLRAWVEVWRRKGVERGEETGEERADVRWLVKRFGRENLGRDVRRSTGRRVENPSRANVLGMKSFWEKVGREGGTLP